MLENWLIFVLYKSKLCVSSENRNMLKIYLHFQEHTNSSKEGKKKIWKKRKQKKNWHQLKSYEEILKIKHSETIFHVVSFRFSKWNIRHALKWAFKNRFEIRLATYWMRSNGTNARIHTEHRQQRKLTKMGWCGGKRTVNRRCPLERLNPHMSHILHLILMKQDRIHLIICW